MKTLDIFIPKRYQLEYFLILLLPLTAVFSIFFLEFILVILIFSFLWRIILNFEKKYFINKFFIIFSIFNLYLLVNYFLSEKNENFNYLFVFFYFRYGLYVISIYYFLDKIENLEINFLKSVIFIISILILDSFFQFYAGHNLIGNQMIGGNRVSSFFGEESILGSYLIKILPFLYLFLIKNFTKKNLYFIFSLIILANIVVFISGERAAFFLMVLMNLYFIVMDKNLRVAKILLILVSFIFIIIIFLNSNNTKQRYLKTFKELVKSKNLNNKDEHSIENVNNEILNGNLLKGDHYIISPSHNNYFITSIRMFKDNKIFGHGPKSFRYKCKDKKYAINIWSCSTHPHNYYIQLLAELGLIGFSIPFLVFIFFSFKSLILLFSENKNSIKICCYAFIIINLWPLTTTGNFFNNWLSIMIYLPFSFYLFNMQKYDN